MPGHGAFGITERPVDYRLGNQRTGQPLFGHCVKCPDRLGLSWTRFREWGVLLRLWIGALSRAVLSGARDLCPSLAGEHRRSPLRAWDQSYPALLHRTGATDAGLLHSDTLR